MIFNTQVKRSKCGVRDDVDNMLAGRDVNTICKNRSCYLHTVQGHASVYSVLAYETDDSMTNDIDT